MGRISGIFLLKKMEGVNMKNISYIITSLFFLSVLIISGCKGKGPEEHEMHREAQQGHMESAKNLMSGKVLDTMNAAGYTYVYLDTGEEKVWVAIPESKVEKGQSISVVPNMELKDFKSKSLNKVFDRIIFATGMNGGEHASPHETAEEAPMGMSMGMTGRSKALSLPEGFHIEKAPGENGYTIAEIYKKRSDLNGKTISVNGYVTKVLTGIMGKNWIHIKDGTEPSVAGDLVITTQDLPNPGDTITATGKLSSDRDFGAGYRYDAILEDAKITIISKNLQDLSKK